MHSPNPPTDTITRLGHRYIEKKKLRSFSGRAFPSRFGNEETLKTEAMAAVGLLEFEKEQWVATKGGAIAVNIAEWPVPTPRAGNRAPTVGYERSYFTIGF